MSIPTQPAPARLVVSLLFPPVTQNDTNMQPTSFVHGVLNDLKKLYGSIDYASPVTRFTQTDYYNQEMGKNLLRQFVSFSKLQNREDLADIKLSTNTIEKELSRPDGRRIVNIDPGLLSVENFILATGKNFTHRIYLRDGIFAEVTLLYTKGRYSSLPWTYWDYAAQEVVEMLHELRVQLLAELKQQGYL